MKLAEAGVESLALNPFAKIGSEWMLITAGDDKSHNTMTASWGGLGVLWGRNVATVYVRPQRYTRGFMDGHGSFSIGFFDEKHRSALNFCGTKSGRDCDKPKETGLTPVFDEAAPYYAESELVFICRKLYAQDFDPELFFDKSIVGSVYPDSDFHRLYVGEIVKALARP